MSYRSLRTCEKIGHNLPRQAKALLTISSKGLGLVAQAFSLRLLMVAAQ
jgi:hypothetical protein